MQNQLNLTEVVWRSQCGEDAGEELQTNLDLRTVAVPATTYQRRHVRVDHDNFLTEKTHDFTDFIFGQTLLDIRIVICSSV